MGLNKEFDRMQFEESFLDYCDKYENGELTALDVATKFRKENDEQVIAPENYVEDRDYEYEKNSKEAFEQKIKYFDIKKWEIIFQKKLNSQYQKSL